MTEAEAKIPGTHVHTCTCSITKTMVGRGMKRPRPGVASGWAVIPQITRSAVQDLVMPNRGTSRSSRRSTALLSAATILALVGCSVLLKDIVMLPELDGRYSRMLSSVDESELSGRSQEAQAQIDAFYAKYFGGANPTTAAGSSTESMTGVSLGAGVIEKSAQAEEDASFSVANAFKGPDNEKPESEEPSDLGNHDETTVIAGTDGEKEASKVEQQKVREENTGSAAAAASDPYSTTPFCPPVSDSSQASATPQYKCGESADQPSPRTEYSASSRKEHDDWALMAQILQRMATKFGERVEKERQTQQMVASTGVSMGLRGTTASVSRKRPIIFLGDGIFEAYLGTSYGQPSRSSERDAIAQSFATAFSTSKYAPLVQAIEGDMTQHLLHRLQNGALHPACASDPAAIYVVLIGTANLSAGHLPQETARGILAVVQQLMDEVAGRVLLLQPLPRGDASTTLSKLCPTDFGGPRCDKEGQPLPAYKPDLDKVRYALENALATLTHRYPGRIHLLQRCAQAFWPTEEGRGRGEEANYGLMLEDGWHPNTKGHEAIGRCLLDCIEDGVCS